MAWLKKLEGSLSKSLGPRPEAPKDWSRSGLSCNCRDCAGVNDFMKDGNASKLVLTLAKARAKHLQQVITRDKVDLVPPILPKGSPNTLVLTKTSQSYEKIKVDFEKDEKGLLGLRKLLVQLT